MRQMQQNQWEGLFFILTQRWMRVTALFLATYAIDCNVCSPSCDECVKVQLVDSKPSCEVGFGVAWGPVEFVWTSTEHCPGIMT